MEEWQIARIQTNSTALVQNTHCDVRLLNILLRDGVISATDYSNLNNMSWDAQNKTLYDMVIKESNNVFEKLVRSLAISGRKKATEILDPEYYSRRAREERDDIVERSVVVEQFGEDGDHQIITIDEKTGNTTYYPTGRPPIIRGDCSLVFKGKFGDELIAVKIFPTNEEQFSKTTLKEELNEIKKKNVKNTNIVQYFGCGFNMKYVFIAMELCRCSLYDLILPDWMCEEEKRMRIVKADFILTRAGVVISPVDVLRQMTSGLEYLHSKNIVHRGLTPKNVLFQFTTTNNNNNAIVKLCDYGLGPKSSGDLEEWAAPETRVGGYVNVFSFQTDVFSLGVLYYYVLSNGSHPFGNRIYVSSNIRRGTHSMEKSKVDGSWFKLIKLMLSKDPDKRPEVKNVLQNRVFTTTVCNNHSLFEDARENEEMEVEDTDDDVIVKWNNINSETQDIVLTKLEDTHKLNFGEFNLEYLEGQLLMDLIHNKDPPKLFTHKLPELPSDYTPRKFVSRNIISDEVIRGNDDLFMFTGINERTLAARVYPCPTATTLGQFFKKKLGTRFLILDVEKCFDGFCECAPGYGHNTVHWLHANVNEEEACSTTTARGRYTWSWVKSWGYNMHTIQQNIAKSDMQLTLSADELLEKLEINLVGEELTTRSVCIAGIKDAGKSMMLKSLANKLSEKHPDRFVLFMHIKEFRALLKNHGLQNLQWKSSYYQGYSVQEKEGIITALSHEISEHELGRQIFVKKVKHSRALVDPPHYGNSISRLELLIDGFGDSDDMENPDSTQEAKRNCMEYLKLISHCCDYVRLWVATRPHLLEQLENCLETIAYSIQTDKGQDEFNLQTVYANIKDDLTDPKVNNNTHNKNNGEQSVSTHAGTNLSAVVGKDFPLSQVCYIIVCKNNNIDLLAKDQKWEELGMKHLHIPQSTIEMHCNNLAKSVTRLDFVIGEMLANWVQSQQDNATVGHLVDAFRRTIGVETIADDLINGLSL